MSRRGVALVALVALAGWLPFLGRPLSPDEGGFLMVGSQWGPGSSLYGDLWVDRPPVLVGVFALADAAGGPWALRLLGCLAVAATVALAALLGRVAAPGSPGAPLAAAGTAAVFAATPLFGGTVVHGEVLALPFVVGGLTAAVAAVGASRRRSTLLLAALAGSLGVLAALTKQSQVDALVAVLVLVVTGRRWLLGLGAVLGGALTLLTALAVAERLGTPAADLWDALVVFRGEAARVIADSATSTTPRRFAGMVAALVGSAAPFVAVGLLVRLRHPVAHGPCDLKATAVAVLAWELVVVLFGGSYWLHYLMGLVPGLVLLAVAAAQRRPVGGPTVTVPYALAALSTLAAVVAVLVSPPDRPEEPVIDYLETRVRPGDTGVVAFGGANILRETGLTSPYEHLWSLPVRVRDPRLDGLVRVLSGDDAPTWVVTQGERIDTWGVAGAEADRVLRDRYLLEARTGDFVIFRLDEAGR